MTATVNYFHGNLEQSMEIHVAFEVSSLQFYLIPSTLLPVFQVAAFVHLEFCL